MRRAATVLPPNFPTHATPMTRLHIHHALAESSKPTWVRRPLKAKNSGNRNTTTRSSSLSASSCANPFAFGMMQPIRNAPNSAWMPMASVVRLESRSSTSVTATRFWLSPSLFALRPASRWRNGRTSATMTQMYSSASTVVRAASPRLPARAIETTNARMHHAVTSSTAAQVIVTAPTFECSRRRSTRMRASTGNAVMLIAAPMNSVKEVKGTVGAERRG